MSRLLPGPGAAVAFLLGWLARPFLGRLARRASRLAVRLGLSAALLAVPTVGAPALAPVLGGALPFAPAYAQQAPAPGDPGAGPGPDAEAPAARPGAGSWGELGRLLGDLLGGVRAISDATRTVADFVTWLSALDWYALAWELFKAVMLRLAQAAVGFLHGLIDLVLRSPVNFISQTPEPVSYGSPVVRDLWDKMRRLANAGIAVVALVGGLNVVLHNRLGTPYHEAMAFLPRLAVGAVLANTSLHWTGLAIWANNLACDAIGRAPLPGWQQAGTLPQAWADLVLVGIYLVVAVLLLAQMLLRLALVDLLIVVSPLAMLLWVLPQTQGWARRWTAAFSGFVFAQFVQVVALRLGGGLTLELTGIAPDARAVSLLLGVTMLGLTLKVPALLNAYVGDGMDVVRQLAMRTAERLFLPIKP